MLVPFGNLISWSTALYKKNVGVYFKYILLSLVPYILMMALFAIGGVSLLITGFAGGNFGIGVAGIVGIIIGLIAAIALSIVGVWFNIAFVRSANSLYNGQTSGTIGERLREAKPLVWRTIGTSILVGLYSGGPLIIAMLVFTVGSFLASAGGGQFMKVVSILGALLGLFGLGYLLYMSVKLIFSVYLVMVDGVRTREAMQKSKSMVEGRWLGIFGRLLGGGLVFWLMGVFAMLLLGFLSSLIPNMTASLLTSQLLTGIVQLLLTPLFMNLLIVLFNESKKVPATTTPVTPQSVTPPPAAPMN